MALSEVQQFYRGKTIFITGATGYMGKVLVEKLLYTCSELEEIFVLMRPKRGQDINVRLETMLELPVFQRIKTEKPEVFKKLTPVQGDVALNELGLSGADLDRVLAKTNIVFHCAATLRLEAELKDAVNINLFGTKRIIDLSQQMNNLDIFFHLSTAFCYFDHEVLPEKVLESPHNPDDIMRLVEWIDEKSLKMMTQSLMEPHPNTYIYTKRLAETLVKRAHLAGLPCAILRPSIVTPAAFEPLDGWVDSLNGPMGVLVAGGKGIIRTMLCNADYPVLVIPVDLAINGIITGAYKIATATEKLKDVPVFNMTSDDRMTVTFGQIVTIGHKVLDKEPFEAGLWYPADISTLTTSRVQHKIYSILFHWGPAYILDFIMFCIRQPRFMRRVQQKVADGLELLEYFTTNKWNFENSNALGIYTDLSPKDKIFFNMDPSSIDIPVYIRQCILGARQYCMKEPLTSIPKARRQLKFLYVLDKVSRLLILGLFLWAFLKVTGLNSLFSSFF